MKKAFIFISVLFFFISCHRNKPTPAPVTCDNYGVGATAIGNNLNNVTLVTTNINTGQVIKNYQDIIQVYNMPYQLAGIYDHLHNYYYLFGYANNTSTSASVLYRLNTSTGIVDTLGYPAIAGYIFACNSTLGKLYFLTGSSNNYSFAIYELTPNDTGFSIRLVFDTVDNSTQIYLNSSAVVAENTGCIYFSINTGNSGNPNTLVKVDPVSGSSSLVQYPEGPLLGLMYNNNDGMIYGAKPYHPYPNVLSVSYISIDPVTDSIYTIVDSMSYGVYNIAFDYCNNLYVCGNNCFDVSTGQLVKQINTQNSGSNVGIY